MLTTQALSISLVSSSVDAGQALRGQIVCHQPVPSGVIRLELQHTDRIHGTPWTLHTTSTQLPPEQRPVGAGIDFDYHVPEWVPPTFAGRTLRHDWTLVASIGGAPPISVGIHINPAPAGVTHDRRSDAEAEWRYQRQHHEQLERRKIPPRHWDLGDSATVAFAALAATTFGLVTPTIAVVAAFLIIRIRWDRRRPQCRGRDITVTALTDIVDTGQQLSFDIADHGGGEIVATLRCTEWRMTDRDGASSAAPTVIYEQTTTVQTPAHGTMVVPYDALPSVKIGPSAVHWHLAVRHRGNTSDAATYPVTVLARTPPADGSTPAPADVGQYDAALDTSPSYPGNQRAARAVRAIASFVTALLLTAAGLTAYVFYIWESAYSEQAGDDAEQFLTVELGPKGSTTPQAALDNRQRFVMTITDRDAATFGTGTTSYPFEVFTGPGHQRYRATIRTEPPFDGAADWPCLADAITVTHLDTGANFTLAGCFDASTIYVDDAFVYLED